MSIESYYNARYFLDIVRDLVSKINYKLINAKLGEIFMLKENIFRMLSERRSNRITTLYIFWIFFEDRFRG